MERKKYRYHVLRNWATYRELKENEIERYLNGEHIEGLYEEWVVMTKKELKVYKRNPPNYDVLVRILEE